MFVGNQTKEKVEVRLEFINQRGEVKKVKFYMDKITYDILHDESISEEVRQNYLIDEYHEYERERKERQKYFFVEDIEVCQKLIKIDYVISSEENYLMELEKAKVQSAISTLTKEQQEIVDLIFYKGLKKKEVADKLGVSKQAIDDRLKRIYEKLKKILK